MEKKITKPVKVGDLYIGGGAPIVIQSMTNTKTSDVSATLEQIQALAAEGCQLVRLAVPTRADAKFFGQIKKRSPLPMVADIHFDYRIAMDALHAGADKIRINPGNINNGLEELIREIKHYKVPIRIGVNGGSLSSEIISKMGNTAAAMVESARIHIERLNALDFDDIVVSLKSSSVIRTTEACRFFRDIFPHPLHLGVTETGPLLPGCIKSAVGIGSLLLDGIGDTVRVSLSADPVEEVIAAKHILRASGLTVDGVDIISCPKCGRCKVDLLGVAEAVSARAKTIKFPLKIAVMGCSVNGPGEAKEADIAICGGEADMWSLFASGNFIKRVPQTDIIETLFSEINERYK